LSDKRVTLLLASLCGALALVAFILDWSFVIGRRGVDIAEGSVANYVGGFWLWLALVMLSTCITEPSRRKRVGSVLTYVFAGLVFGSLIYMLISKPA